MLSFECLSSLNVSSPGCQQVVRSLAACWKTDQSIEVTQPVTTVVIQPRSTKSSARLLHSRRDWCSGRKGWMSQYIRKQFFTVLYTIWSHTVQYMFLHFNMQLTKQTLCEKKVFSFQDWCLVWGKFAPSLKHDGIYHPVSVDGARKCGKYSSGRGLLHRSLVVLYNHLSQYIHS